jgi:hypothetical protein
MKTIIIAIMFAVMCGCTSTSPVQTPTELTVKTATITADTLTLIPSGIKAAYDAKLLSSANYNAIADKYNMAVDSYDAADDILTAVVTAKKDPSTDPNYQAALASFLGNWKDVLALLQSFNVHIKGVL